MAEFHFEINESTAKLIDELKVELNARDAIEVLTKALALTKEVVKVADADGVVLLRGKASDKVMQIALR